MKKIYYSIFTGVLFIFISLSSKSQVIVSGSTGANGTYTTLTDIGGAFAAINTAGTQAGNNITVSITADLLAETGAIPLNASDWTTLTISPSGGAIRNVQGNVNGPLIDLNGADNVTIDGLNTGGNALNIDNQNGVSASTIRFINDASNNTLIRCNILGASGITAGPALGTIYFAGGTTTGNDNNAISQCILSASVTGTPQNAIYSLGTSAAVDNSNNTIFACLINDFFNPSNSSTGVNINSFNSGWLITTNVFYQTATRTATTGSTHNGIFITSGTGYTINNNVIGGSNPSGGGTAWTYAGAFTTRFVGINISTSAGITSNIQNNTITNFLLNTTSGAAAPTGIFCGIVASGAGSYNIGTTTGNTIGANTGTASIATVSSSATGAIVGVNLASTGTVNFQNNTIGALQATSGTATIACAVVGVHVSAVSPLLTISNNIIGNSTTNNMQAGNPASTTPSCTVAGVNLASTPTALLFNNNTIQNLISYGSGTGGFARGFFTTTSATAGTTFTITNNTIRNLTTSTASVGIGSGVSSVVGIHMLSGAFATISGNTINNLANTNTVATTNVIVSGITLASSAITGTVGTNCFNNRIYDLRNSTVGVTATTPPIVAGISIRSGNGNTNIYNNMISIGNAQTTNTAFVGIWGNHGSTPNPVTNIYYNSVNIEGAAAAGALSSFGYLRGDFTATTRTITVDIRNNIFTNSRTGGTGSHYAISNNFGATVSNVGWPASASNYNVLNANAATIGHWTTAQTIAGWRTASASDANSLSGVTVTYINTATGDLHLNFGVTPTLIESAGQAIAGYTTDYDNDVRPGPAGSVNGGGILPDLGADETDAVPLDVAPPNIFYTPLTFTCTTGDRVFTANIQDITGVPTSGVLQPRVYYRKNAGAWFSSQGTLSAGTNKNGTWTFTIIAADMGGIVNGDVIQYYVIAQDIATPTPYIGSNPGAGLIATDVNTVTTAPTTPNSYNTQILNGTYTVGVAGNYTTLTAAINDYNTSCLGGPIVFSLINAAYTITSDTIKYNPTSSSINTLTIKPTLPNTVINGNSGAIATGALVILGADYITVDGSISNTVNSVCPLITASRDLTINNLGTSTSSAVITLNATSGGKSPTNNTIKNCNVAGNTNVITLVGINNGGTGIASGAGANFSNNNSIVNNNISKSVIGIFTAGSGLATKNANTLISQNLLNTASPNNIGRFGIMALLEDNIMVTANVVDNIVNTASADAAGITIGGNGAYSATAVTGGEVTNATITGNTVGTVQTTSTFSAIGIALLGTSSGTNSIIANNMISGVAANGTSGDIGAGILLSGGTAPVKIYHNSVAMQGTIQGATAATQISTCFGLVSATPVPLDLKNNIFSNTQLGNAGATLRQSAIALGYASPYTGLLSNYNDLYSAGAGPGTYTIGVTGGLLGTNRVTLADWQTETGGDANSLTILPVFVSATNLHLDSAVNCTLNGKGDYVALVSADFDCNTRDNPNPDMGADEFTSANLVALSGTPGVTTCESKTINPTGTLFVDASCNRIARVVPSGASPVSGVVNTCIYVETLPSPLPTYNAEPYLPVHYDVTPATNPLTSTGTITLYFLQSDFDNYNLNNGVWPDLPNAPGDAAGIANLRITQYHGSATPPGGWPANPSLPNQYSAGTNTYINPNDANIVWNVVHNYWEVTFDVIGFSGFYVHTNPSFPLPIVVNYLQGTKQGSSHNLNWKVTCVSSPSATMVLERSADNRNFAAINTVTADALRCAQPFNYVDASPLAGVNYYRLRITDANGKITYSNTIALVNKLSGVEIVGIAPNPVTSAGAATLNVASAQQGTLKIVVTDLAGRQLITQTEKIIAGSNQIPMNFAKLSGGSYQVTAITEDGKATSVRFVKQ